MTKGIRYLLLILTICATGCSSIYDAHSQKSAMMSSYLRNDNARAVKLIADKLESTGGSGDELMWQLEAGSANFALGNFHASVRHFEQAEQIIEAYDYRAIISLRDGTNEAVSLFTNPNILPYKGLCRDRIALHIYKSLAYLGLGRDESFRAQIARLRREQSKVATDYATQKKIEAAEIERQKKSYAAVHQASQSRGSFTNDPEFKSAVAATRKIAKEGYADFANPMARFLSAISHMNDANYDNARAEFAQLHALLPHDPLISSFYVAMLKQTGNAVPETLSDIVPFPAPYDRDIIYLIFANGRSAAFKQIQVNFPLLVAWPICEYYPAPYNALSFKAMNAAGTTTPIADMDAILAKEYDQRLPAMITRIVINTLVKEGGSYTAAYFIGKENATAGYLFLLGTFFYRYLFNTADTRTWEILPKSFQASALRMPSNRRITVSAGSKSKTLTIPVCRSAIIFVNAPSENHFDAHLFPLK